MFTFGHLLIWRDVRYEDDNATNEPVYKHVIAELEFSTDEYDREILRYRQNAT